MLKLPNLAQLFWRKDALPKPSEAPRSRSTSALSSSRSSSSAAATDSLRTARLGQPSKYESKSQKNISTWWKSQLSPRSIEMTKRGFEIQGVPKIASPIANVQTITPPELTVWAQLNMKEDDKISFAAQVCPSKEQELASSSGSAKSQTLLVQFLATVSQPKPLPGQVVSFQRLGPSKFVISKLDSMEVTKIKGIELTIENNMFTVQIHHVKLGAWVWCFRNEWERNEFVRHLSKLYYESVGKALSIGGITKKELHTEAFLHRYFENAHLRKDQNAFIKARRKMEKEALKGEKDLTDDEDDDDAKGGSGQVSARLNRSTSSASHGAQPKASRKDAFKSSVSSGAQLGLFTRSQSGPPPESQSVVVPREILVGRDLNPKLGMHVALSRDCSDVFIRKEHEGTGAVTGLVLGPGGVEACEVEWYRTGRRAVLAVRGEQMKEARPGPLTLAAVPPSGYRVARSDPMPSDEVVGLWVYPFVGMRVRLRRQALEEEPRLLSETKGKSGTVTWICPDDRDGDGIPGDAVLVQWDSGGQGEYLTGYKGRFELRLSPPSPQDSPPPTETKSAEGRGAGQPAPAVEPGRVRAHDEAALEQEAASCCRTRPPGSHPSEQIVGLDVTPRQGMRVVICKAALREFPELQKASQGSWGTICWVDPSDEDGDGVAGDVCSVLWNEGGKQEDYRTGYKGMFRLARVPGGLF